MAELNPCPFCGGEVIDVCEEGKLFGKSAYSRTYRFVRCRRCYARTGVYGTNPKAIEAWNSRAESEELKFTREFIHEHGLDFELASAWKGRIKDGK